MEIKYREISTLKKLDNNPRKISPESMEILKKSLQANKDYFEARPLILSDRTGELVIIAGNQRYEASKLLGWKEVPTVLLSGLTEEREREIIIRDNVNNGEWDEVLLKSWDADELKDWGVDLPDWGKTEETKEIKARKLSDRYIIPPFSILDARKGYWQERKKIWNELIGDNGTERSNNKNYINQHPETWENKPYKGGMIRENSVSILDPVMAEVVCKWYGIDKGNVFDVFAGDTVFGYVAASKGMNFIGIELRKEQTDINNERTKELAAKYICDDGRNVLKYIGQQSQDLLFSCPPYYNLEVYSEDIRDASNQQSYNDFIKIIDDAFSNAIKCLKDNRFAVIVVGDIRDRKNGTYYCFPDDIKRIFRRNDMCLYNDIVLIQPIGNAALRANVNMKNRKVVKLHENVLVFYKGDTSKIKDNFKPLEYESEDLEQFTMDE